ncbi:unnamed protein product [Caenorhabditis auriculariae]|uniref:G-protein coupled receptors family 1 profile domain-containing protein n=1 Tax=Caenorhabditis auriculariae TaxID=2777116 RepID=A0A8S1HWD4_9PELO|nr:unnamed protein product [Caenorhabditis auriculariae]
MENSDQVGNLSSTALDAHMFDLTRYDVVSDVLPPPNHEDLHVMIMAIAYLFLFLLGTCGNVAVLTTIYHILQARRGGTAAAVVTLDNTLLYMVVLSCVDFGVCLSLPITVIDQILGFWMFGVAACKLHAVFENVGKILSALILTAMSFDRYAGVCHPQKKFFRSRTVAVMILVGLGIYAVGTLCPLLWSFTAREIVLYAKETGHRRLTRMKIEKCTVDIDSYTFTAFTIYQFVLCYCTPLVLIAYFYTKLLCKLKEHTRSFKASVACFHFICWTPFWAATVFAVYLENVDNNNNTTTANASETNVTENGQESVVPPAFVYVMYFIHALPFTNSAINWILYGALNGQLQQRPRRAGTSSCHNTGSSTTLTTCSASTGTFKMQLVKAIVASDNGANDDQPTETTRARRRIPTDAALERQVLVRDSAVQACATCRGGGDSPCLGILDVETYDTWNVHFTYESPPTYLFSVEATDHQIGRGPVGVRQDPGENQEISFTWFEPKIGSNIEPRSEALCYTTHRDRA